MRYLSVCAGIEAASVAWRPLGWRARAVADIDLFANAVTAHHYPDVPNLGDLTKWRDWDQDILADADILVGGTPCQAFSVAGLRNSLSDERGNLSLEFVRLADAIDAARSDAGRDPGIVLWENVPGVLSVKDNAFGCFLAALAGEDTPLVPTGGKWTNAGVVIGPKRAIAWRVLDAQYFGLAQRRRRVFVVASARDGFDPATLFPFEQGMRRDSAPRRKTGQAASGGATGRAGSSGGPAVDFRHESLTGETVHTLQSKSTGGYSLNYMPGVLAASTGDISHCLNAGGMGRQDYETETLATHSLRAEGFDASEDGTGRGTPLVPVSLSERLKGRPPIECNFAKEFGVPVFPLQEVGKRTGTSTTDPRAGIGIGEDGDPMYTLQAGAQHGVATAIPFDTTQITSPANYSKPQEGDPCHPLAAGAHPPAVAVGLQSSQSGVRLVDTHATLDANNGSRRHNGVMAATINHGENYADAAKAGPVEALRALRRAVGEEAFTVWGFGVLAAFQPAEVLQPALHGCGLRPAAFSRSWMVRCALGGAEHGPGWLLQSLRETGCEGCPPQGWEPSEQLNRELGAYLSRLSQPGASAQGILHDLWCASEGPGVLREALSAVQALGQSAGREGQPVHVGMAVRRLTATEYEFLQGFPRGYTNIPWRGKPEAPDGPRYKSLGNSMAVPVMRWIGRRIAAELARSQSKEKAA
jgi:DNA (cytosine-5)-methyltransferase 1